MTPFTPRATDQMDTRMTSLNFHPGRTARRSQRRAFTLLELLITLVIIAIFASITAPRLFRSNKHEFELFVERVGDMLTMYAQRENLMRQPIGLRINETANALELVVMRRNENETGAPSTWYVDRFVDPIRLPDQDVVERVEFRADGAWTDIRAYPLANDPARPRPNINVFIYGPDQQQVVWTLPSHAVTPRRYGGRHTDDPAMTAIDLDAEGRTREDW